MMLAEVEQSKKRQNALFVKDAGQTGRALIKMQQEIRNDQNFTELSEKSLKLGKSFDLLLLQPPHWVSQPNHLFHKKENTKPASWKVPES